MNHQTRTAPGIDHPPAILRLPAAPEEQARREFPLLASIAPVVGALVMWAVTQSPFALVFAFLGPVIAVASLYDDRRHGRRRSKTNQTRFAQEVSASMAAISAEHGAERQAMEMRVLGPLRLLDGPPRDPEWWRGTVDDAVLVCLGSGTTTSLLTFSPLAAGSAILPSAVEEAHAMLRHQAGRLTDAPVIVDARDGIGIVGPQVQAEALVRGVLCQLLFQLSPIDVQLARPDGAPFDWLSAAPHREAREKAPAGTVVLTAAGADDAKRIVCAIAQRESELPRDCRTVVRLDVGAAATRPADVTGPCGTQVDDLRPQYISEQQARALAGRAHDGAIREGLVSASCAMPEHLRLETLEVAHGHGLPATFMVGSHGPVSIDLVADGPHAIIGGTTGSGKSELLISWVLAMAGASGPSEVNFLLIDFKGGSSFTSVQRLPHTVGLVTDLDQDSASRAMSSMRAELRYREQLLASAQVRSVDELPAGATLPRLVIVVDEFAVVVSDFPDLQELFTDIAARGRSLGVHLILCTQRPAGVVRDSVLANCTLRLSLRVNNHADSVAVVASGDAAALPRHPFGRCYLSVAGATPSQVQVAISAESDVEGVLHGAVETGFRPRRPWLDPLPECVSLSMVADAQPAHPGAGLAFGLSDVPSEQKQPAAVYDPGRQGNLIVMGGHGSGKTVMLAALHEAAKRSDRSLRVVRIPSEIEGAWDGVAEAVSRVGSAAIVPELYLIDDVDALLGRLSDEHRGEFSDRLTRLLREGAADGRHVAMTAARLDSATQSLATLCDSRLLLRMPNRQEYLLAGGTSDDYSPDVPAGAGTWHGHRVQVACSVPVAIPPAERPGFSFGDGTGCAVVTARPNALAERLRASQDSTGGATVVELSSDQVAAESLKVTAGSSASILIGDTAGWQSQWMLLAAALAAVPVLFIGCSVGQFRSLTGVRELPAPIGRRPGAAWVIEPGGMMSRVQLPDCFCDQPIEPSQSDRTSDSASL